MVRACWHKAVKSLLWFVMNLTEAEYNRIKDLLPLQRGNVRVDNLTFLNAILYVLENGCKWRALPKEFGQWSTIYKRFRRWSENGVLNRVFTALNEERLKNADVSVLSLDSTWRQSESRRCRRFKKTENSRSVKRGAVLTQKYTRLSVVPPWLLRCPYRQETCTTRRKVERSLRVLRDAFLDQIFWWTKPMKAIAREIAASIAEWFLLCLLKRTDSNLGITIKSCINGAMKRTFFSKVEAFSTRWYAIRKTR